MAMHSQVFDFSIGEKVEIIEINRPATVTSLIVDHIGVQYLCVYWNDGQRYSAWLLRSEIKTNEVTA